MWILQVNALTKKYKKFTAVNNVSIGVEKGSIYGLVGLNGAGKTTIIKSITGLLKKFDGDIIVNEFSWGDHDYKKQFSFLPELFTPPPYLTGYECISFLLDIYGASLDKSLVHDLCYKLNFDKILLNKKTKTYSKGTMQKLGLIQTVCAPTKFLILDEPMSGLDPLARARFKYLVADVNASGRSLFLSTHILHDIDSLCTHIGVLNRGELLFSGDPMLFKENHKVNNLEEAFLLEIKI